MPTYDFQCISNHQWTALVMKEEDMQTQVCPKCGLAGIRIYSRMTDSRVLTKEMSAEDRRIAQKLKRYHESPEIEAKIRSGELGLVERGPNEHRPRPSKRFF